MESVVSVLVLFIFFIFVYGYSLYFHENHKDDPKKLYIPMKDIDGFTIGSQSVNSSSTCDPNAVYKLNGDNSKVCLNNGSCIEKLDENSSNTGIYNCSCVKPFIGDNCWSKGTINQGVRVDITDNFTSPTEIVRIPMIVKKGNNYFIQDNDNF